MGIYTGYFRAYRTPFLTAVLCVTLEAFCDLLNPTLMAQIINKGIQGGSLSAVLHWGLGMLLVTALGACFAVARNILASYVSQRMGADLRRQLFFKITGFAERSADTLSSGSLIIRMTNDTAQIVQFVNGIMRVFLKAPVTCIGSIVLASLLNFRLSLILYAVVLLVTLFIVISMKLSYPRFSRLQQALDRLNSVLQEYLNGVRLVKAFGTYEEEGARFGTANNELLRRGIASQLVITLMAPLLSLTVGLGTALVIYAGSLLFPMRANVGDISAFTIYMAQILTSLLVITNVFNTFVRTKASSERLRAVFDSEDDFDAGSRSMPPESQERIRRHRDSAARYGGLPPSGSGAGTTLPASDSRVAPERRPLRQRLQGDVEFENVTFAYPGGSGLPVLKHLSFAVPHGRSLSIIGPTGSGKSTIAWLLLRFYDVDEGRILLDGRDIRDMNVNDVRHAVSIVPQTPVLFSGSVADNLKWGDRNAGKEELFRAIGRAQARFVLRHGLDGPVRSGGVNLSGGQKQRLSIARGLLKDAPVLILDDATSALDAITEARVREELLTGAQRRTTLLITQRCTTARFADRILVLEDGAREGFGTHAELLSASAVYRDLYRSQVEGDKEI